MIFQRKFLIGTVATAMCLANASIYAATTNAQDVATQQKAPAAAHGKLLAAYRGVLPCADCPGIDTTVRLFADPSGAEDHGRYVTRSSYQERNTTNTEAGTWTLEKGTPNNASASVYVLKPKTGNGATNFLVVGDNEIKQLDADRKPFAGTVNFTLKRIGATAPKRGGPAI
jgi:copper homeostasis protein (lipoprotein)